MQHNVLILDFGSQYTQLIARRVRELNIFCEIFPYNHFPSDLSSYKAVILGGSPFSVRAEDAPHPDLSQIRGKLPVLAVCYGAQYLAHFSGGEVASSNTREYGRANLSYIKEDEVFFQHGGGVTFSGGEPFMQGEFLIKILKRCQKEKIHTAIETSFYTSLELIKKALPYLDLVYIDLKIFDEQNIRPVQMYHQNLLKKIFVMFYKVNIKIK